MVSCGEWNNCPEFYMNFTTQLSSGNSLLFMKTPFSVYLDTNYVPSDLERSEIENLLRRSHIAITAVDNIIAKLRHCMKAHIPQVKLLPPVSGSLQEDLNERLQVLSCRREQLLRSTEQHEKLLTPMRAVPIDVLRIIFLHCLDNSYTSPKSPPLLLTYVCRSWRQVALETRELWTSPHIVYPNRRVYCWKLDPPQVSAHVQNIISLYLARAGNHLLSLSIRDDSYSAGLESEEEAESLAVFINTILASSTSWKRLALLHISMRVMKIFLNIPRSSTPNLEYVHIVPSIRDYPFSPFSPTDGLLSAPWIRGVRLVRLTMSQILALPIQWSNLTELDTAGLLICGQSALDLMQRCESLVRCCISFAKSDSIRRTDGVVTCPHLAYLKVSDCKRKNFDHTARFFSKLDLPALESLSLDILLNGELLGKITQEYGPTLRQLCIRSSNITVEELVLALESCPQLDTLELSDQPREDTPSPFLDDTLLSRLTPTVEPTPHTTYPLTKVNCICPRLRDISIYNLQNGSIGVVGGSIHDEAVFQFIKARRELVCPSALQNVRVIQTRGVRDFDVIGRLRKERVDIKGMVISLGRF